MSNDIWNTLLTKLTLFILNIRMCISNQIRYIMNYFYNVKDVSVIIKEHKYSVFCRYIFLLICKLLLIDKIYKYLSNKFDIDSDSIQIIKTINYVDKYIIYEKNINDENKKSITTLINYVNDKNSELQNRIMLEPIKFYLLERENDDCTESHNITNTFKKYIIKGIYGNNIKNILDYNNIKYNDDYYVHIKKPFSDVKEYLYRLEDIYTACAYDLYSGHMNILKVSDINEIH